MSRLSTLSTAVSDYEVETSESVADIILDYPAYELYTDVLRKGIFSGEKGKQLRLVVGRDRRVKEVEIK